MRLKSFVGTLLGVAFLSGCVTTAQVDRKPPVPLGSVVHNQFNIGYAGLYVPLEEGPWQLVGYNVKNNNSSTPIASGVLAQVQGDTVSKLVTFMTPLQYGGQNGYVRSKFCERTNIHYIEKKANYARREQDCWGVNHWRMTLSNSKSKHLQQAWNFAVQNKLKVPSAMIAVQYRKADSSRFLNSHYYFNPEVSGFEPPKESAWSSSDWHPQKIYLDDKKIAYVGNIKNWGSMWNSKVDSGFARK